VAVLIRHRAAGLTLDDYDTLAPRLVELVKQQPGFVMHVVYEDSQGTCVAEVWESKEQHDSFFNEHVVPNVPAEIAQEVVELHAVHRP
jgi:quinol monooxygenase YgiN